MTKQEQAELIALIDDVIERKFEQPKQPPIIDKIKSWLQEQGTQRGFIRVLSGFLIIKYDLDAELAVSVVAGSMALIGFHDAVTRG